MIFQPPLSLVRRGHVYPLDCRGLLTQVITQEEVTGFVETNLPGTQTADTKGPQSAVDGGVRRDLLPEVLHVAFLGLGHVASEDSPTYCKSMLAFHSMRRSGL